MSNPIKILQALRPGALFSASGLDYDGLEWLEPPGKTVVNLNQLEKNGTLSLSGKIELQNLVNIK